MLCAQCDQDAYACSGQKCSAQSILFMHDNWAAAGGSAGGRQMLSMWHRMPV